MVRAPSLAPYQHDMERLLGLRLIGHRQVFAVRRPVEMASHGFDAYRVHVRHFAVHAAGDARDEYRRLVASGTQPGDPRSVGRPHRAQIVCRIRGEPAHRTVVQRLDVQVRVVAVFPAPDVNNLLAVRRERRLAFRARQAGDRNDLRLRRPERAAANLPRNQPGSGQHDHHSDDRDGGPVSGQQLGGAIVQAAFSCADRTRIQIAVDIGFEIRRGRVALLRLRMHRHEHDVVQIAMQAASSLGPARWQRFANAPVIQPLFSAARR